MRLRFLQGSSRSDLLHGRQDEAADEKRRADQEEKEGFELVVVRRHVSNLNQAAAVVKSLFQASLACRELALT